jgi:thiamine biosynthesis lipoprotein
MKLDPMNLPVLRNGRRQFLCASIGIGSALLSTQSKSNSGALPTVTATSPRHWKSRPLLGFGTTLSLTVGADDIGLAERALDLAVADIRLVESLMSLFDSTSAVSQLNARGELRDPHPLLVQVLTLAQEVSRKSSGAFDVTVQPVWQAYANAQQRQELPSAKQIKSARAQTGWQHLGVSAKLIRFTRPNMAITLNGIAQGFAADVIRARWQDMGIRHALINTGEWTASGAAQDGQPWRLGIADPRDEARMVRNMAISGKCVATSADNQTYFTPDFKNHHIFDPHTGRSPTDVASVTVVANSTALADALTKVMFVGGMKDALRLAKLWSVKVLMVDKAGNWIASPGLSA